ncbi:glycosyltransferase family 2 protein [Arthrobacter wenxiniae]|uniref:glycosyltransferase family 2 protein n=1 Tax=Arthrobacter wenxiniae TaxID=2713570 RepID=UPI001C400402
MTAAHPVPAGNGPALSIVVPVYNVGPWLAECLDSMVNQSFGGFEIIVVNDGSTDSSADIARSYAASDARVKVFDFENGGLGRARNRGLELCSGTYVLFADSDDRVPAGALQAMMDSLTLSGSDFVTGKAIDFYTDPDKFSEYWTTVSAAFSRSRRGITLAGHPELIHDHTVWNKAYSLEFLRKNAITFSEDTLCEDVFFCAKAYTLAGTIDIVSDYVYEHRRRRGAISNSLTTLKPMADWITETGKVLALLREQPAGVRDAYVARILRVEAFDRARWVDAATPADVKISLAGLVTELLDLGSPEAVNAVPARQLAALKALQLEVICAARPRGKAPRLSVVVPTLNVERWIDDCLLGIRRQDFDDLEILVVDDGSEDRSIDAIAEHVAQDPRIHFLRSYGAGGGTARNVGTEQARGVYLAFADGDDMVPQGAYSRFVAQLDASGSDMAVGDYIQLSTNGVWHPHWKNRRFASLRERITIDAFPELLLNRCCWDKMFRRTFWDRINNFFPDARRANDIGPMVRAYVGAAALDVVPGHSYVYRRRPGSSSMTAKATRPESLQDYLDQERICAELVLRRRSQALEDNYFAPMLDKDLWVHLRTFLSIGAVKHDTATRLVFDAAATLLRLVPAGGLDFLEPRKQLVYHLILAGTTQPLTKLRSQALTVENGGIGRLFPWREALLVSGDENIPLDLRRQAYSRGVLNRLIHEWAQLPAGQQRAARGRLIRFAGANVGHMARLNRSRTDILRFALIAAGHSPSIAVAQRFSGKGHPKARMRQLVKQQPVPVQRAARAGYQALRRLAKAVTP